MDSYSVNEAAAVLGIPEGRVWELLARGVLAGSTEVGGDMRVVLRGATLPDAGKLAVPNGVRHEENGGHGDNGGHADLTPFRELLTEFRNLTERYGQALLALGESRGEVAALRGRVDLLEARIDRRSPWAEATPAGWTAEALPEPEPAQADEADPVPAGDHVEGDDLTSVDSLPPEDMVDATPDELAAEAQLTDEPAAEALSTDEPVTDVPFSDEAPSDESAAEEAKPHRTSERSRSREAVSAFAEALARAEDPTTAEVGDGEEPLPGAEDIADAIAAYRDEVAADAAPVVRAGYSTATPEPDWIAEEDLIVIGAAFETDDALDAAVDAALDAALDAREVEPVEDHADEEDATEPETAVAEVAEPEVAEPEVGLAAVIEAERQPIDPDAVEVLEGSAPPVELAEAERPDLSADEPIADDPLLASGVEYAWLEDDRESEPDPLIAAISIGGPDEPPIPAALETPEPDRARTPYEIAAEPPAPDDVALLVGPVAFSEPPQVPREPAFWEAGARSRAPFAVAHLDAWEASATEAMRIATEPEVAADAPASRPDQSESPSAGAPARSETAWPESDVGWGSTPEPSGPVPGDSSSESAASATSASAARPKSAVRRRRGPAARAIRRLRILLD